MNVRDISAELGISIGSVESIIYKHIVVAISGLCPVGSWFTLDVSRTAVVRILKGTVPLRMHNRIKLLNFEQKFTRLEVCRRLLTRYDVEGDGFLTRIFTTDETWVHYYTPESKVSSKE